MSDDDEPALPHSVYRSDDTATTAAAACGGCALVLIAIAIAIAPICLGVSGVVFLVQEYSAVPDCAHAYKVWSIVMVILFGLLVLQSSNNDAEGIFKTVFTDMSGAGVMILAAVFCIPAAVGYARVVLHVPDTCDLDPLSQLHTWTWFVIGYYGVLSGLLALISLLRCFGACRC